MESLNEPLPEHITITQAARIAHVGPQAVYLAMKKGRLKALKINQKWYTTKKDLDDYHSTKYTRDDRRHNGERIYDFEKGKLPAIHVAKMLSAMLKRPITVQFVYYLLRKGVLKGYKMGPAWIIDREDVRVFYKQELEKEGDYIASII